MKNYIYTRLFYNSTGIFIKTSDPKTVDFVFEQVKKLVPGCELDREKNRQGRARISQLKGRDEEIGDFVTKILCQSGWEPFAVSLYDSQTDNVYREITYGDWEVLHLRKESET